VKEREHLKMKVVVYIKSVIVTVASFLAVIETRNLESVHDMAEAPA